MTSDQANPPLQDAAPIDIICSRLDTTILLRGRVVIIGLGGIGLWLARSVVVFLAGLCQAATADDKDLEITLLFCDGDAFGLENTYRMDVPNFGNKAEVVGQDFLDRTDCPGLNIRWSTEYVTEENIHDHIEEGDCVLLACDNHATRNLVSRYCAEGKLHNVVLISGGNDGVEDGLRGTYGNVQVYVRENGRHLSAPLHIFHPDIAAPSDEIPEAGDCLQQAASGVPQLSFINMTAASAMCNALLRLMMPVPNERIYDEVAFDILDAVTTPHWLLAPKELTESA